MKKSISIMFAIITVATVFGCKETAKQSSVAQPTDSQKQFASWKQNAQVLTAIKEYVADVTDANSKHFIPVKDRIVVFDLDGTMFFEHIPSYCEWVLFTVRALDDPSYQAPDDVRAVALDVRKTIYSTSNYPHDMGEQMAIMSTKAFAGMTQKEYADYIANFLNRDAYGFKDMKIRDGYFKPMLEVLKYLQQNDFEVYIVTGTDRFTARVEIDGVIDIPPSHLIGTDVTMIASGQGVTAGMNYAYSASTDKIVRGDKLIIKNDRMNKVSQMIQEIGKQPVLAFGNSTGDASMLDYVITNNKYTAKAFLVLPDDTAREYGNIEKAQKLAELAKKSGWTTISMANDWNTIFGRDFEKTVK